MSMHVTSALMKPPIVKPAVPHGCWNTVSNKVAKFFRELGPNLSFAYQIAKAHVKMHPRSYIIGAVCVAVAVVVITTVALYFNHKGNSSSPASDIV